MAEKYRRPKKTQEKIDEIREEADPKKALEGIVDLFENFVDSEKQVPTRYDQKTGKPIQYKWIPEERFEPEIYLGGVNLIDPTPQEPGLAKVVIDRIKKAPIFVDTSFGAYVFSYEERDASGPEQGGGTNYATRHLISVKKVSKLA